ncbi:hypothetical protein OGY18_12440 [Citrobacter sp. Cpo142]|uniref:hypothetical protein n=1 Tax=Citrobacter sp. Cpo142 TaxID=2985151 RepID=UPI002574BE2D|nr:hypothetical protein [Citrobacter sp. Cpo142]MDM2777943.1 hypothetical protein [Citrobacter sp. Cpo142]
MMSLWDALRMNMMISYQELVRTFPNQRQYQQTSATLSSANTMADAYKEGSGDSNKKKHKSKLDKFFGD